MKRLRTCRKIKQSGTQHISNTVLRITIRHISDKLRLYLCYNFHSKHVKSSMRKYRCSWRTVAEVRQSCRSCIYFPSSSQFFTNVPPVLYFHFLSPSCDLFHALPFLRARGSESSQSGNGNATLVRRLGTRSPCSVLLLLLLLHLLTSLWCEFTIQKTGIYTLLQRKHIYLLKI
jgi:hypothetical protein